MMMIMRRRRRRTTINTSATVTSNRDCEVPGEILI